MLRRPDAREPIGLEARAVEDAAAAGADTMTQVEVLREARRHVVNGWRQGAYDDGVECCAVGALMRATNEERMFASLQGLLNDLCPSFGYSVISFNDTCGRTKEEVLALFDHAIKILERDDFYRSQPVNDDGNRHVDPLKQV